jgi:hypothetical protein
VSTTFCCLGNSASFGRKLEGLLAGWFCSESVLLGCWESCQWPRVRVWALHRCGRGSCHSDVCCYLSLWVVKRVKRVLQRGCDRCGLILLAGACRAAGTGVGAGRGVSAVSALSLYHRCSIHLSLPLALTSSDISILSCPRLLIQLPLPPTSKLFSMPP